MSPRKIIADVLEKRLDVIAVTDHNSAANARAVMRSAGGTAVKVLPGMEICTKEEVHILGIFEMLEPALELQELVYARLKGKNDPEVFGMQVLANELDEVEGFEERLLIGATDLAAEEAVEAIHGLEGLAIASHIDREAFGVISQLGFIPEGLVFDALEISRNTPQEEAERRFPEYRGLPWVRSSDAHRLEDLGTSYTECFIGKPSLGEIHKALRGEDGRMVRAMVLSRN
jgi:hypothetical protein